ncbi:MAG: hypothetical protein D6770_03460 [Anaerolineae bacterium]|nr:MAG: hypothetical protein D6770_03460 [Anaerolineae bacterium]
MPKAFKFQIHDAAGWTMFVFGVLAFLLGLTGLLRPEWTLTMLGFEVVDRAQRAAGDYTIVFVIAASMASFNMGVYYVLAALNDLKAFYRWTVPFRGLTFLVFTTVVLAGIAPTRFIGVGLWEGLGAIATGLALYFESDRTSRRGNGEEA